MAIQFRWRREGFGHGLGATASWTAAVLCRFLDGREQSEKRQRTAAVQDAFGCSRRQDGVKSAGMPAPYTHVRQPDRVKENSLPIHRWVPPPARAKSRQGGQNSFVPGGTGPSPRSVPTDESVGYFLSPCRAGQRSV